MFFLNVSILQFKKRSNGLGCLFENRRSAKKIADHIQKGTYSYSMSAHALERQHQQLIDLKHVLYVLKTGTREENKDFYDVNRQT